MPWTMTRMTLCCIIYSSRCALCPCTIHWNLTSHHLPSQTQGDAWFKPSSENIHAGVCLRINPGQFRVFPYENRYLEPFEAAVRVLNPMVAVKIRSAAVHVALGSASVSSVKFERSLTDEIIRGNNATAIYVDGDTRIQILDTMFDLPRADKEQCGAFIVSYISMPYTHTTINSFAH